MISFAKDLKIYPISTNKEFMPYRPVSDGGKDAVKKATVPVIVETCIETDTNPENMIKATDTGKQIVMRAQREGGRLFQLRE